MSEPIEIHVSAPAARGRAVERRHEPLRLGIPLARGQCESGQAASMRDGAGQSQPVQTRALDRWPDGSIRWLLVDFEADHDGSSEPCTYRLDLSGQAEPPAPSRVVAVAEQEPVVTVSTGPARFDMRVGGRFPFDAVLVGGVPAIDPTRTEIRVETVSGTSSPLVIDAIAVEDAGPLRVVVHIAGRAADGPGVDELQCFGRLHFFAGSPVVQFELTLRNPRPATHPGGFWELGDRNALLVGDVSLTVAPPAGSRAADLRCAVEPTTDLVSCGQTLEVFQASSGGINWACRNHVNRRGAVPLAFRGYRMRSGAGESSGERATPLVTLAGDRGSLAVTMPQFWQNFPKAIEASPEGLTLRLFPRQHADGHELQPGEQKTHVFSVACGQDPVTDVPLAWAREPLFARTSPAQYCGSEVVRYLAPLASEPNADYVALVSAGIEGPDRFELKREIIDEFGWRNFGDLYADHEAAYYTGPAPVISHYNNQYDAVGGFLLQFMRSADPRWWCLAADLAAHVVDIDLYHTVRDRSIYDRGAFWHTAHYVDAGLSTHRAYPRAPGVYGGGPSNEHNYSSGLMLHYFLTGHTASRDGAIELARWVVDMDDGDKRVLRWLARGDTGFASSTYSPLYNGPGRGAGNSIVVLLNGFRLTGDRALLHKAEQLIRRCIHPADDIDARGLLNAESRWSYTVFLHALGRYLDEKVELGEVDAAYVHARRALLAYARWMVDHERPYLDRPDELEYPTETWVAQELWKSEVFAFAAKYTDDDGGARTSFLERSAFFFRYAMATLGGMRTRASTRPLVLLLSRGLMQGYLTTHPGALAAPAGPPVTLDPVPAAFVPQKVRAVKRFRVVAAAGAVAVAALCVVVWWHLR